MKRANLEGASLKNCKFEASSNINTTANLEGILILIFVLTHFVSLDSKLETSGSQVFSGGIERVRRHEMG